MAQLKSGTRIYGTATVDTQVIINGTATAISTTTGAIVISGGIGIGQNLVVGNELIVQNVNNDVSSSSTNFVVFYNPANKQITRAPKESITATDEFARTIAFLGL